MKKIAIQIDPLSSLNIKGDSSVALALEAQTRGFEIATYQPQNLFVREGEVYAKIQKTTFKENDENYAIMEAPENNRLAEFDCVLMRQDPPFDMHYITATYFLDLITDKTLVMNNPTAVRSHPEKILPLHYKHLMPRTLMSTLPHEIKSFREKIETPIILKPLYGNGGKGVVLIEKNNKNFDTIIETMLLAYGGTPIIAQEFIQDVAYGDKRIILIDGEPVAALNRIPAQGDIRANLGAGASGHLSELNADEIKICQTLEKILKKSGIFFAGIDVIAGRLTEINITSPTGIRQIKELGGADVAKIFWDKALEKL